MLLKILIAISFISTSFITAIPLLPELPADDTAAADDTGFEDSGATEDTGAADDTGSDDTGSDDTGSDDTGSDDTGSTSNSTTVGETYSASELSGEKGGCSAIGGLTGPWLLGLIALAGRRRNEGINS